MSTPAPLIALISATPAAIAPAATGLARGFPAATVWNILDDRLLVDADQAGGVNARLHDRMLRLIDHAVSEGADAILLTCSLYGSVAHAADVAVPILAPDDASFAAATDGDYSTILVVASFAAACDDAVDRFRAHLCDRGVATHLVGLVVPDAFAAAQRSDGQALLDALVTACREKAGSYDAVLLAQYSLAPTAAALSAALGVPVISGPDSAARALLEALSQARAAAAESGS